MPGVIAFQVMAQLAANYALPSFICFLAEDFLSSMVMTVATECIPDAIPVSDNYFDEQVMLSRY
jgi:hypothetical protein